MINKLQTRINVYRIWNRK